MVVQWIKYRSHNGKECSDPPHPLKAMRVWEPVCNPSHREAGAGDTQGVLASQTSENEKLRLQ